MRYQLTADARISLAEILFYMTDNEGATLARRFNDAFFATCEMLADMPGMGHHPQFSDDSGLLCFNVKGFRKYLIFYRKRNSGIAIIEVFHGARDLPALFSDE